MENSQVMQSTTISHVELHTLTFELSQLAMLLSGQSPGPVMLLSGNGEKNLPQPHTIVVFLASYQKPTKIVLFVNQQLPRVTNMKSLNHLVYVKT
mgnify:CR=1 FL=1